MMNNRKKILLFIDIAIISILAFPIILTLFNHQWFLTHELNYHIIRINEYRNALMDGIIFPRWMPNFYNGYGYPFFNYYAPLPFAIGALLSLAGIKVYITVKIIFAAFLLFSGITMYLLTRHIFNHFAGIISGIIYIYFPYHLIDIFVRGNIGETLTFAFCPLALLCLLKNYQKPKIIYSTIGASTIALLIFSHTITALICISVITTIALVLIFFDQSTIKDKLRLTLYTLLPIFGGIGLSAVYWLPAIIEKQFVQTEGLFHSELLYFNNFLSSEQLINTANFSMNFRNNLGFGTIVLPILFSIFILLSSKIFSKKQRIFSMISLVIVIISVLLMVPMLGILPTDWLWENVPLMKYIQFPWRLLLITSLFSVILIGAVGHWTTEKLTKLRYSKTLICYVVIILLAIPMIYPGYIYFASIMTQHFVSLKKPFADQKIIFPNTNTYQTQQFSSTAYNDYLPKTANAQQEKTDNMIIAITDTQQNALNETSLINVNQSYSSMNFKTSFTTPTEITLHQFYFPGWSVKIDKNKYQEVRYNENGLIVVDVPEGEHAIKVKFRNTPIRNIASAISIMTLMSLIGIVVFSKRRNYLRKVFQKYMKN